MSSISSNLVPFRNFFSSGSLWVLCPESMDDDDDSSPPPNAIVEQRNPTPILSEMRLYTEDSLSKLGKDFCLKLSCDSLARENEFFIVSGVLTQIGLSVVRVIVDAIAQLPKAFRPFKSD
ncbi:hypothetical protein AVEN_214689-1 [Araneus ventricosus]|uniref:Uncharacterized protein n=1 Tax=Araneus ventricosus TaxID=182803 RepID=A0A4Y2W8N3_ARAVE|nr:hypothetical protein AVEN_125760-1 [Araneus ventricosus]GBO32356.1 hypothetical protein AVEN_214689-1 [Araneus ventricosus]